MKQSYKPECGEFNDRYKLKRRSDFNATALLKAAALVENQRYICAGIRNNKLYTSATRMMIEYRFPQN